MSFPKPLQQLINALRTLPGVGPRTAARYAYSLIKKSEVELRALAEAIRALKETTRECSRCHRISERDDHEWCSICRDSARNQKIICVVESDTDLEAIEAAGIFRGLYHVLGGSVIPIQEEPSEGMRVPQLLERIHSESTEEVILAMNASTEGEATTLYLLDQLKPLGVKVTRLARGLQTGGDVKYLDERTLKEAFEGRK